MLHWVATIYFGSLDESFSAIMSIEMGPIRG